MSGDNLTRQEIAFVASHVEIYRPGKLSDAVDLDFKGWEAIRIWADRAAV